MSKLIKLELREDSWRNLLGVIRSARTTLGPADGAHSTGNLWAAVQHLERQLEEIAAERKRDAANIVTDPR